MTLEIWNLACLVADRVVSTKVLVLSRYPKYFRHRTHFSLEQNHLTEYIYSCIFAVVKPIVYTIKMCKILTSKQTTRQLSMLYKSFNINLDILSVNSNFLDILSFFTNISVRLRGLSGHFTIQSIHSSPRRAVVKWMKINVSVSGLT